MVRAEFATISAVDEAAADARDHVTRVPVQDRTSSDHRIRFDFPAGADRPHKATERDRQRRRPPAGEMQRLCPLHSCTYVDADDLVSTVESLGQQC
jgi:hypothetical protein